MQPPRFYQQCRCALACATVALMVAGCSLRPPPSPEEIRRQAVGHLRLESPWRSGGAQGAAVQDDWLASFGDARLQALVAEALAYNPDLHVTATRIEQAAGQLGLARAAQRPSLALVGTGGVKVSDMSSALSGLLALMSWEVDLWGSLRYASAAAADQLAATRWDLEFARQSLAANTAKAWFTAAQTRLEEQAALRMVELQQRLLQLAIQRRDTGPGSDQEVVQAQAALHLQRDGLAEARLAHQWARRALESLLGRYPGAEIQAREDLPALPGPVPAGLPLQMLERRPDLRAAEQRVAGAFNRVGQARAAALPLIQLTANLGYLDSDVLALKRDFENPTGGAGARLLLVDLDGAVQEAQFMIVSAQQREAVAQYVRLALRAIADVEAALAGAQVLDEREGELVAQAAAQGRALQLAQTGYEVGKRDLRAVEQERLRFYQVQLQLLRVRGEQLSQRVDLHLALGGSFGAERPLFKGEQGR